MSTFGEELRRERKLRRIALREVAEATKVNLRYLEALERNDFQHLPGGVFNRGFVRAYAQYIGIDPDAMVNAYLMEEQAQAVQGKAQDRHLFHRSQQGRVPQPAEAGADRKPRSHLLRYALWGALVVALALLLGWLAAGQLGIGDGSGALKPEVAAPGNGTDEKGEDIE
jgi:cytoskeletal protein RodZ